jgi:hypothetical protein
MKKQLLTIASGLLLTLGVNAQSLLIDANFNDGSPAGFTAFDGDKNPRSGLLTNITSWGLIQFTADPTNQFFASFAEYSSGTAAEDWLYSQSIDVPAGGTVTLKWASYAYTDTGSELQVAVSTTGGAPAFANYTVETTITNEAVGAWNTNTLDLSAYAGETVKIAFIHTSNQTQYYFIDNIKLEAILTVDIAIGSLELPSYTTNPNHEVFGYLQNLGLKYVESFDLTWYLNDNLVSTETISDIYVGGLGNVYAFTATNPIALTEYGAHEIRVEVSNPNGTDVEVSLQNNVFTQTINYWSEIPAKRVLFEEGTGTWCGWCPRGAVVLETMLDLFPESFIGVAVHNADPMVVSAHDGAVGGFISGYPGGVWEHQSGTGVSQGIADAEFAARTAILSPFKISSVSAFDSTSRVVTTTVRVTPVINMTGTYKIGGIITEDGVTGTTSGYNQANYYSFQSQNTALVGAGHNWQTQTNPVPAAQMVYDHVSRALFDGGYNGKTGSLPSSMTAGVRYEYTFTNTLAANVNEEEVTLVTFITNPDNSASNASKEKLNTSTSVSISELAGGATFSMYPNPANESITLNVSLENNTSVALDITNMVGAKVYAEQVKLNAGVNTKTINLQSLPNGIYTVSIVSGDVITTQRLVISK